MIDVTDKIARAVFVETMGFSQKWNRNVKTRRIDVYLNTIGGREKKFTFFLKEDQKELCGLPDDPDFETTANNKTGK